ncbi:MAG: hypothetical protein AAF383_26170 [Cyanobacteria bacterium P01_A01_bin.83]
MTLINRNLRLSLLFSLLLLLITFSFEGWLYCSWVAALDDNVLSSAPEMNRFGVFYGAAVAGIILLVVAFTSPVSLMTASLDNWLKSDTRAFISIFIGAFAVAISVQRIDYFARLAILVAAVFLLKLDLQLLGCNRWLCSFIITIFCWLGFTGGYTSCLWFEIMAG